jgi:hypothetical protein
MRLFARRLGRVLLYLAWHRPDILYRARLLWPTPWVAFRRWLKEVFSPAIRGGLGERGEWLRGAMHKVNQTIAPAELMEEDKDKALRSGVVRDLMAELDITTDDAQGILMEELKRPEVLEFFSWPISNGTYRPGNWCLKDVARNVLREKLRKARRERHEPQRKRRTTGRRKRLSLDAGPKDETTLADMIHAADDHRPRHRDAWPDRIRELRALVDRDRCRRALRAIRSEVRARRRNRGALAGVSWLTSNLLTETPLSVRAAARRGEVSEGAVRKALPGLVDGWAALIT